MEEDIKILENLLEEGFEAMCYLEAQAIEHLIKAYKGLEEDNEFLKLKEKNRVLGRYGEIEVHELINKTLANDYIPISLVEEKIEELKQEGNYKTLENPDGRVHFQAEPCDYKIQVLEELLGKGK